MGRERTQRKQKRRKNGAWLGVSGIRTGMRANMLTVRGLRRETIPTVMGERNPGDLDFEVLISLKIFDRNSKVRFYKVMAAIRRQRTPVHNGAHGPSFNHR